MDDNQPEQRPFPQNIKYWTIISKDSASLAIDQTEELLKEIISTSGLIQKRAETLMTALAPIATSLLVFIFSNFVRWSEILFLSSILCFLVILWSLCAVLPNLNEYIIEPPGNYPEQILNNELISPEETKEEQFIQISLNICSINAKRIAFNKSNNLIRLQRNQKSLKILFTYLPYCPIIALACHYFYLWLSSLPR